MIVAFWPLVLLLPLVLLVGLIVLLTKSSRTGRWLAGGIVAAALLLLLLRSSRSTVPRHEALVPYGTPHTYSWQRGGDGDNAAVVAPLSAWSMSAEDSFQADVYPSAVAAARALAGQVADWLAEEFGDENEPVVIRVQNQTDHDLLEAMAAPLRALPGFQVLVDPVNTRARADEASHVSIDQPESCPGVMPKPATQQGGGTLRITATGKTEPFLRSVRFVRKPWLRSFAEFVNRNPQAHWLLAYSGKQCFSEPEAHEEALRAAVKQLIPYVQVAAPRQMTAESLQIGIQAELRSGRPVVDRFMQSFRLPLSNQRMWREALLIDTSPRNVASIARRSQVSMTAWRSSWLHTIGSSVALVGVICLVYLFLNAATKGYFTWPLRMVMVLIALAGVIVLVLFIA